MWHMKTGEMAAEYSTLPSKENLHLNYKQTEKIFWTVKNISQYYGFTVFLII